MLIGVPREIATGERRVALVPEVVSQLTRAGHRVVIEHDAGLRAGFIDDGYRDAGAEIVDSSSEVYANSQMILKVQRPGRDAIRATATTGPLTSSSPREISLRSRWSWCLAPLGRR